MHNEYVLADSGMHELLIIRYKFRRLFTQAMPEATCLLETAPEYIRELQGSSCKTSELLREDITFALNQPPRPAVHFLIESSIGAKYPAMSSVRALVFLPAQVFDK